MISNINEDNETFFFNNIEYRFGKFDMLIEEELLKGNIKFAKYLFNNKDYLYTIRNSYYSDPLDKIILSLLLNKLIFNYGDIKIIKLLLDEGVVFNELGAYNLGRYIKTDELFNLILNHKGDLFQNIDKLDKNIFIYELIHGNLFDENKIKQMALKLNVNYKIIKKEVEDTEKLEIKDIKDKLSLLKKYNVIDYYTIESIYGLLFNDSNLDDIIDQWTEFLGSFSEKTEKTYKIDDNLLYDKDNNLIDNNILLNDIKDDLLIELKMNYNEILDILIDENKNNI